MRRSLFIPLSDRSSWDQLTGRTVQLLRQLLAACPQDRITLVGESVRRPRFYAVLSPGMSPLGCAGSRQQVVCRHAHVQTETLYEHADICEGALRDRLSIQLIAVGCAFISEKLPDSTEIAEPHSRSRRYRAGPCRWRLVAVHVRVLVAVHVRVGLARQLNATSAPSQFGGCLALRVALAAPDLVERMVLVNPATCFARSLGGLAGAIAATNLLSLFPAPLYEVRILLWRGLLTLCCSIAP